MDPALLTELRAAIEEIGHSRFGTAAEVAEAKKRARGALIAFGQQPLPVTIREAATFLAHRLDDIHPDQQVLDWESLLHALQELDHAIAGASRS
jgi:hypothetical protein